MIISYSELSSSSSVSVTFIEYYPDLHSAASYKTLLETFFKKPNSELKSNDVVI